MTKLDVKQRAIELRHQGLSYTEIQAQLNVSCSLLSRWLRHIVLTDVQRDRLRHKKTGVPMYNRHHKEPEESS